MCGIFGFLNPNGISENERARLRESLDTLHHRGPDATGEYIDSKAYLGHRRLSIIDLSEQANQPLKASNVNAWIVFNGEIYNYKQLRREFSLTTRTQSDTEVVLEGYLRHGVSFFKSLRGMYAFGILDARTTEKLVLVRDPAGIKPLYYSFVRDRLIFASEIKAIRHQVAQLTVDNDVIKAYLSLGYCPEPHTAYKEIKAVVPGSYLSYSMAEKSFSNAIFFSYSFDRVNNQSFHENLSATEKLIEQAVQRNGVSDVPISYSLSGGIDSSLVLAKGKAIEEKVICVKFGDRKYDESETASRFASALNKQLTVVNADARADLVLLDKIFSQFDQPYADSSAIPFFLLAQCARQFSKVLLGGDGGDEVQGGYPSFGWLPLAYQWRKMLQPLTTLGASMTFGSLSRKLTRLGAVMSHDNYPAILAEWNSWLPPLTTHEGHNIFLFDTQGLKNFFIEDGELLGSSSIHTSITKSYFYKRLISDYLRKTDMMSMFNGLEYRVPLLDEDFVEFSLSIPYSQKVDFYTQKKILRGIHRKIFPPDTSLKKKSGFGIPLDSWLSVNDYREMQSQVLSSGSIIKDLISERYIKYLFQVVQGSVPRTSVSRAASYQRILMFYNLYRWQNSH